jgi:hypothetical protein
MQNFQNWDPKTYLKYDIRHLRSRIEFHAGWSKITCSWANEQSIISALQNRNLSQIDFGPTLYQEGNPSPLLPRFRSWGLAYVQCSPRQSNGSAYGLENPFEAKVFVLFQHPQIWALDRSDRSNSKRKEWEWCHSEARYETPLRNRNSCQK